VRGAFGGGLPAPSSAGRFSGILLHWLAGVSICWMYWMRSGLGGASPGLRYVCFVLPMHGRKDKFKKKRKTKILKSEMKKKTGNEKRGTA
jgi:hypothetical protein